MEQAALAARTTALVLAGGAGTRAGGADKGLLPYRDGTLIDAVIGRIRPQAARIVISCNRHRDSYARRATEVVKDLRPGYPGPLAGIEAGLAAIDSEFVLLCPCDVPTLPDDIGLTLYRALVAAPGAGAAYVSVGGRDHWLCALLARHLIEAPGPCLDAGEHRVHAWLRRQRAVAAGSHYDPLAFSNLNDWPA